MRRMLTLLALAGLVFLIISPLAAKTKREQAQDLMSDLAKSRDDGDRANAAWQLGQMKATDSVPALILALEDRNDSVRANAAGSLWNLGEVSKPAIAALRKALMDPYAGVVSNAAGALVMLGVPRTELVPVYKRLLMEEKCRYRIHAVRGLMDQVPPTDLFRDALECSRDPDLDNAFAAGDLLRELMDGKNQEMIPLILDALRESGDNNASDLALAIVKYKPPVAEAVPALENLFRSANPVNRSVAATSLELLGDDALAALPTLVNVLGSDPDAGVRAAAAKAIGAMGIRAREAVPSLMQAAREDRWPKVRQAAMQALGEMGEGASEAIPVLSAALNDPDEFIRIAARNALPRVDPKNKAVQNGSAAPAKTPSTTGSGNLFGDADSLAKTLSGRLPEAVELIIYENFAIATAPEPTSSSGYGRFTYRNGGLTGPDDGTAICTKTFRIKDIDFSVLPKLVREAPGLAEKPDSRITHVILSRGVFCKDVGWFVYVTDGSKSGMVEFKPDGKLKNVTAY